MNMSPQEIADEVNKNLGESVRIYGFKSHNYEVWTITEDREASEMDKRMMWNEIVSRYPDQWVGLVDVDWKNESNVRSAVVKYTDKSSDELAMMQLDDDNLYSTYTTPDNLGQFGIVGYLS